MWQRSMIVVPEYRAPDRGARWTEAYGVDWHQMPPPAGRG
jgi:hypothetical protein